VTKKNKIAEGERICCSLPLDKGRAGVGLLKDGVGFFLNEKLGIGSFLFYSKTHLDENLLRAIQCRVKRLGEGDERREIASIDISKSDEAQNIYKTILKTFFAI
jgi:hypothetical protein